MLGNSDGRFTDKQNYHVSVPIAFSSVVLLLSLTSSDCRKCLHKKYSRTDATKQLRFLVRQEPPRRDEGRHLQRQQHRRLGVGLGRAAPGRGRQLGRGLGLGPAASAEDERRLAGAAAAGAAASSPAAAGIVQRPRRLRASRRRAGRRVGRTAGWADIRQR